MGGSHPLHRNHSEPPMIKKLTLWGLVFPICLVFLPACTKQPVNLLPPAASEAVEVYIPVTKPCEVVRVEPSVLPSASGIADDIFEAAKAILADRSVLLGDREKLVAANTDPCPEISK